MSAFLHWTLPARKQRRAVFSLLTSGALEDGGFCVHISSACDRQQFVLQLH
jgi:hypothetical protein